MSRKLHKSTPVHTIHINVWKPTLSDDVRSERSDSVDVLPTAIHEKDGLVLYEFDPCVDGSHIEVLVPIGSENVLIDIYK